jgi:hypothetical protein
MQLQHPEYANSLTTWERYRYILTGGTKFVEKYLIKFSEREEAKDFSDRLSITYCPAHAEAALTEIKNAIYQRLADAVRSGGTPLFQETIAGKHLGVDRQGHSIMEFLGDDVLIELLGMGKVGIYVDMPMIAGQTKADTQSLHPYCYVYTAENILSWTYENGILTAVLLREYEDEVDKQYGLTSKRVAVYRLLTLEEGQVRVRFFNSAGVEQTDQTTVLKLNRIPLIIAELSHSLLKNIDGYQIALLNLASSDLIYSMKANFTFYTEQYDPAVELTHLRRALHDIVKTEGDTSEAGSAAAETVAKMNEVRIGAATGRRYPKGLEKPDFIGPPTDPITASLEKQRELRKEIREIIGLNIANLEPQRESAEAKEVSQRTLEAGLSYIGLVLQYIEREFVELWALYVGESNTVTISYPKDYSLKSDTKRYEESEKLVKTLYSVESKLLRKELAKAIVTASIGHKLPKDKLDAILVEIDGSELGYATLDMITDAIENQLLSTGTGAKILGLNEAEATKAKKDHADRIMLTLAAQSKLINPASRGAKDLDPDPKSGEAEKDE